MYNTTHDDIPVPLSNKPTKFLDRYRTWLRLNGYAYQTEKHYIMWAARFIRFHDMKHPESLSPEHISDFLSEKALKENQGCRIHGDIEVFRVPGNFHIGSHSFAQMIREFES